ncbi:MAG: hypothetical protein H0V82_00225 [Candidatus Protochlamydia sp.]|nr:hypothetical protein [Candidatus Protochlamydia sp.]
MQINFDVITTAFNEKVQPQLGRLGRHIVKVLDAGTKLAASHPFASLVAANVILCETSIGIARLIGEGFNRYVPNINASPVDRHLRTISILTTMLLYIATANYIFITTFNIPLSPLIASTLAIGTNCIYLWVRP